MILDPESDDDMDNGSHQPSRGQRLAEQGHKAAPRPVKSRSRSSHHQAPVDRTKHCDCHSRYGDGPSRAQYYSSEQEDSHEVDVLRRHQKLNGVPKPPSQDALRASQKHRHHASSKLRHDSLSDDDTQANVRERKAERRNFWPSMWKVLIDEAKVEWRLYLSVTDAFPNPTNVKDGVINDVIQQMFRQFKRRGRQLDNGYFPRYRPELSTLVGCIIQAYPLLNT